MSRYYRYTLKGDHTLDEAQRALGEAASQGLVVRLDSGGGQTQVYVSGAATAAKKGGAKKPSAPAGVKVEVVSESEVLKVR